MSNSANEKLNQILNKIYPQGLVSKARVISQDYSIFFDELYKNLANYHHDEALIQDIKIAIKYHTDQYNSLLEAYELAFEEEHLEDASADDLLSIMTYIKTSLIDAISKISSNSLRWEKIEDNLDKNFSLIKREELNSEYACALHEICKKHLLDKVINLLNKGYFSFAKRAAEYIKSHQEQLKYPLFPENHSIWSIL